MSTFKGPMVGATDLILNGIEVEFKRMLFARLAEYAQQITTEVAEATARNVTAKVAACHNVMKGQYEVIIRFNETPSADTQGKERAAPAA